MKKLLQMIGLPVASLLLAAGALGAFVPAAYAAPTTDGAKGAICEGLNGSANCANPGGDSDVKGVIKLVISIFSWVVGIAAVIMIIVGGFKYVISSGDSGNINSAKNTILYALVGLIVVALAQVIVKFVLDKAT